MLDCTQNHFNSKKSKKRARKPRRSKRLSRKTRRSRKRSQKRSRRPRRSQKRSRKRSQRPRRSRYNKQFLKDLSKSRRGKGPLASRSPNLSKTTNPGPTKFYDPELKIWFNRSKKK